MPSSIPEKDMHDAENGESKNGKSNSLIDGEEEEKNSGIHRRNNLYNKVELACCVVFFVVTFILSGVSTLHVRRRPIPYQFLQNSDEYIRSSTLNEADTGDTVSNLMLLFGCMIAPLLTTLIVSRLFGNPGDTRTNACIYFTAMGTTSLITNLVKSYVGYLRPFFYAHCQPNDDYSSCTNDVTNLRLSFPSGHASISACTFMILSLYLDQLFGMTSIVVLSGHSMPNGTYQYIMGTKKNNQLHPAVYRLMSFLSYLPMVVALFVSVSRVVDNAHFPADVVAGTILGVVVSIFFYRLWFPYAPHLMDKNWHSSS